MMTLINDAWNQSVIDAGTDTLAPLTSQFFVPRMVNKPQDPILHAIDEKAAALVKHDANDLTCPRDAACAPALPTFSPEMLWAKSVTTGHQHSVRSCCIKVDNSLIKCRIESYLGTLCADHISVVLTTHF